MSTDELQAHMQALGWKVERFLGEDQNTYLVARDYVIPVGSLAGRRCDVAILHVTTVPYVPPAAIHTRPALVAMDMQSSLRTQQSTIGREWQYWSRVVRGQATPRGMITHIATVFNEV